MMRRSVTVLAMGLLGALLAGCFTAHQKAQPLTGAAPGQPTVQIKAFINVSSGCQAATVAFMKKLVADHPGRVSLELVDFGDGGQGARAWQESGYKCMTILLNGSPYVKYPMNGVEKTMAFQMPAGFLWKHEDLQAAVEAGLAGKLQPITKEEALSEEPPSKVEAKVSVTEADKGQAFTVAIDQAPVMTVRAAAGGQTASQRADAAAKALKAWLADPVYPSQLGVEKVAAGLAIKAADATIITVTDADAKAAGLKPEELAAKWHTALKHSIVSAAAAGEEKTPAGDAAGQ